MKDLTKGTPARVIMLFALPIIFGNILQTLYNITDSKIVSEYVSSAALAAVGATAVISNTIIGFINGLTQGFAILIARSFGAKDERALRRYVAGSVVLTIGIASLLTMLSQLLIRWFLRLLKTPEDIYSLASSYIIIILWGILFISVYNLCANALRAVGDSRRPLICLMISIVLNVGLDLFFIRVLHKGIRGAALATIISQAMSAGVCLIFVFTRYRNLIPKGAEWRITNAEYKDLLAHGLSMGLMGCIVNIGTLVLQSAINNLGTVYITAHTAGRRVFDIMMIMIFTLGFAMTTYVSQNLGAGRGDRIRLGVKHAIIMDTIITTVMIGFAYTIGDDMVRWIASTDDPTILKYGVRYVQWGCLLFYVLGPLFILRCTLQGLGHKIVPLLSSGIELLMKILFGLILVPIFGYNGVILTEPISWVVMIIPLIIVYIKVRPRGDLAESRQAA